MAPTLSAVCHLCNGDGFHPDAVRADRYSPCTACNGRATRGVFVVQVVTDAGMRIERPPVLHKLGAARVRALFEAIAEADRKPPRWRVGRAVAVEVVFKPFDGRAEVVVYSAKVGRRPAVEALAAVA